MNILFIDSYYTGLYGAPKSMLSLAFGVNKKHHVTICSTKNGGLINNANKLGLSTSVISVPEILLGSRKKMNLFLKVHYLFRLVFFWLSVLTNKYFDNFDKICVNDIRTFLIFFPMLFRSRKKIYWYVRINDRVQFVTSLAAWLSSRIILISDDCKMSFKDVEINRYEHKFCTLNTGFDLEPFTDNGNITINHNQFDRVYINVGSICNRKNQIAIIDAFNSISSEFKHLYILGGPVSDSDYQYFNLLKSRVSAYGLEKKITFVGHTPNVIQYLKISDVFVFSSFKEGLPRAVIEALMCGCYVVSAKVDGIKDIINTADVGIVTSVDANHKSFDNEFKILLSKVNSVSFDRDYISQYICSRFSYKKFIDGFIDIIS